jgi:serine/threonine protein phosphatase PrpC
MFHLPENSILATATLGNKPLNEDHCGEVVNETAGFNALIVADGLGSYQFADQASAFVVTWLKNRLMLIDDVEALDFQELFTLLKHALIKYVDEYEIDTNATIDRYNAFGTTLICAVETQTNYVFAYAGNGAIWHIKAGFNDFSAARLLPWCANNFLNPDTIEEGGREALVRLISPSDNFEEVQPTIIKITKDKNPGDLIMICTDGIYSQDQLRMGKNSTGIWLKIEDSLIDFYKMLDDYFKTLFTPIPENSVATEEESDNESSPSADVINPSTPENSDDDDAIPANLTETELLQYFLQRYLKKGHWDDDATLGVLITKETMWYQSAKKL